MTANSKITWLIDDRKWNPVVATVQLCLADVPLE
jgi:hypothetical protein